MTNEEIINTDRNVLLDNYEKAKKDFIEVNTTMRTHIKEVLEKWIDKLGMKDYAKIRGEVRSDYNSITIGDKDNNADIDFNFRYNSYEDYETNNRCLTMNYCTFGSFDKTETNKIRYVASIGKIAENLDSIESDYLDFNWSNYWDFEKKLHSTRYDLDYHDRIVKESEDNRKKEEFLKKITSGTEIIIGTYRDYSTRNPDGSFPTKDKIYTVNSVTKKNLMFREDWGRRTKLDYVLNNLVGGKWLIKEKETDTLVKEGGKGL